LPGIDSLSSVFSSAAVKVKLTLFAESSVFQQFTAKITIAAIKTTSLILINFEWLPVILSIDV